MIFGDLTSGFLMILNESWKNETSQFISAWNQPKDRERNSTPQLIAIMEPVIIKIWPTYSAL